MSTSIRRSVEEFFAAQLSSTIGGTIPFLTGTSDEVDPQPPYCVVVALDSEEVFEVTHHYVLEVRIAVVTPIDIAAAAADHEERCMAIKTAIESIPQYSEDLVNRFCLLGYKIQELVSENGSEMDVLVSTWNLRVGAVSLTPL